MNAQPHHRLGFSILEVMIASTVMAVAAMTLMGLHANLQIARQSSMAVNRINALGRSIVEQIVAREVADLGDNNSSTLVWSRPRYQPAAGVPAAGSNGYNLPLTENAVLATDDLVKTGLITEPTGVRNLKVYIEYYFGASSGATGGKLGLYDDPAFNTAIQNTGGGIDINSTTKFRASMIGTTYRTTYRTSPSSAPVKQIQDNDNLLIRVVLTWGDGQVMEFYTAKRLETF